ncbi:MAG: CsgG/HfaB family protein, partial [Bacteroidota bacterium]
CLQAQTFKVVVARFQDRTGMIARKEAEGAAGVTGGAIVGERAGVAAASGQYSTATMESGKGDLGSQAADIFTSELVKTGKFKVLDSHMFQQLLDSTAYKGDMMAAAKKMGAHYLLTGTVTQAGVSDKGGSILGFGGKSVQGNAVISVTLTNVSTGEIALADNAEGTQSEGGVVVFGGQIGGKKDLGLLLSAALHDAVKNCVPKIAEAAGELTNYPIDCDAALNEGKVYLSKGKDDGVTVGDQFEIIGFGKTIKIGSKEIREKTAKGTVRVVEVQSEYAVAEAVGGFAVSEGDKAVKIVGKRSEPVKKKEE